MIWVWFKQSLVLWTLRSWDLGKQWRYFLWKLFTSTRWEFKIGDHLRLKVFSYKKPVFLLYNLQFNDDEVQVNVRVKVNYSYVNQYSWPLILNTFFYFLLTKMFFSSWFRSIHRLIKDNECNNYPRFKNKDGFTRDFTTIIIVFSINCLVISLFV